MKFVAKILFFLSIFFGLTGSDIVWVDLTDTTLKSGIFDFTDLVPLGFSMVIGIFAWLLWKKAKNNEAFNNINSLNQSEPSFLNKKISNWYLLLSLVIFFVIVAYFLIYLFN